MISLTIPPLFVPYLAIIYIIIYNVHLTVRQTPHDQQTHWLSRLDQECGNIFVKYFIPGDTKHCFRKIFHLLLKIDVMLCGSAAQKITLNRANQAMRSMLKEQLSFPDKLLMTFSTSCNNKEEEGSPNKVTLKILHDHSHSIFYSIAAKILPRKPMQQPVCCCPDKNCQVFLQRTPSKSFL